MKTPPNNPVMPNGTYDVSYTPYWNTSKTVTDRVEIRYDGTFVCNKVTGKLNKTMPYTGDGYAWSNVF